MVLGGDSLVQNVELLGGSVLLQQLRRHLALCRQDDSILGKDSNSRSSVGDGFKSVLNLIKAAFGREDGRLQ